MLHFKSEIIRLERRLRKFHLPPKKFSGMDYVKGNKVKIRLYR